jgi:hypothetical protein
VPNLGAWSVVIGRDGSPVIFSRRRALAAILVAAQIPLLVGMAEPQPRPQRASVTGSGSSGASNSGANGTALGLPPNNIVGLNLARLHQPQYIWVAGQIVNANGGSWGYVTMLLTRQDRDADFAVQQLQQVLDRCYEARVQPIVRVSTQFNPDTGIWERPNDNDAPRWRALFEQARWPNRTVWVIPANEPNLGREWGGQVDVPSYARYFEGFLDAFDGQDRFQVVNAPMNLSNPHRPPLMQDAFDFLAEQMAVSPGIFERLPAWATNSYKIDGIGDGLRFTHRGYEAELEMIGREMPVIVTESGVLHRQGEDEIARFFQLAYRDWQSDRRVIAATPLFWDPDVDNHWMFTLDANGNVEVGSATYRVLRDLPRVAGSPETIAPLANTPRVSASAVRARPLPIFMPDTPDAGLDLGRDSMP